MQRVFSKENTIVCIIVLLILGMALVTSGDSPLWIYQGF